MGTLQCKLVQRKAGSARAVAETMCGLKSSISLKAKWRRNHSSLNRMTNFSTAANQTARRMAVQKALGPDQTIRRMVARKVLGYNWTDSKINRNPPRSVDSASELSCHRGLVRSLSEDLRL